eukprot:UN23387
MGILGVLYRCCHLKPYANKVFTQVCAIKRCPTLCSTSRANSKSISRYVIHCACTVAIEVITTKLQKKAQDDQVMLVFLPVSGGLKHTLHLAPICLLRRVRTVTAMSRLLRKALSRIVGPCLFPAL